MSSPNTLGLVRLAARDVRQDHPSIHATDAPDIHALLAALDSTGLAALLAELQALEPVEPEPADNGK